MKKYIEFPDLYFVPGKMFRGGPHTPSFNTTPWGLLLLWIQVIAHLFKKCIIHLGLDKRPLYFIPVMWPPYIPTDLILRFLLGTGRGIFSGKKCVPAFVAKRCHWKCMKIIFITFNPFAAGESMRTWAREVSPCRNWCVEIVYCP